MMSPGAWVLPLAALVLGATGTAAVLRRRGGLLALGAVVASAVAACTSPVSPIDELAHYSVASFAVAHGRFPTLYDRNDPAIRSLYEGRYPGPPQLTDEDLGPTNLIPQQYEAVHPPLSYALWAAVTAWAPPDEALRLVAARLVGALALGLSVAWTWVALGGSPSARVVDALVLALLFLSPWVLRLGAYANNGPVAVFLSALVLAVMMRPPAPPSWSPSRSLLVGSLLTLMALTHWYCIVAVGATFLWLALVLPRRRTALMAAPLVVGAISYGACNVSLYGSLTGLAVHRAMVAPSFVCGAASLANLPRELLTLAQTLVVPEYLATAPRWLILGARTGGALLLLAGAGTLVPALGKLRARGREALTGPGWGAALGALVWNGTVVLMLALPLVTGGGAILGRYLLPVLPFLALALSSSARSWAGRSGPWSTRGRIVLVLPLGLSLSTGWLLALRADLLREDGLGVIAGRVPPTAVVDLGLRVRGNRPVAGGIVRPGQVVQRFRCPVDELSGLRVVLCTYCAPWIGRDYALILADASTLGELARVPLDPVRIRDWGWYGAEFPPVAGLRGRLLQFELSPRGADGAPVTVQLCPPPDGSFTCLIDGEPVDGCVVFELLVPRPRTLASLAVRLLGCRPPAAGEGD